jgi:DNA polymerase III gamma/tau subunit
LRSRWVKRAGLRQQPKPLNIQPAAYVEPAPLSQIEQWEQDQHDARRLKIEQWLAQREAEYKRQHPNWQAEQAAEQEAFEVVFDAIWQRLGSDDAFRQAAAERFGPGYWLEADAMTDAHRVETLERQILLHAETRAEVAASLADADMNSTSVPVPVEDSATEEETDPVELVRMPPLPEPKAKTPEPAPEPEPEPVPEVEGEPEPTELPPVAAEVDQAAQKLAESIGITARSNVNSCRPAWIRRWRTVWRWGGWSLPVSW